MNTPLIKTYRDYIGTFFFIILSLYANVHYSQKLSLERINIVVDSLNRNQEFDQSIIFLEDFITKSQGDNYALYKAYYLKYLTYKSVFNYEQGVNNLKKAAEYGSKTDQKDIISSQIKIENIFILFDQAFYDEVTVALNEITEEDLKVINGTTKAFFYSIKGVLSEKKNNDDEAALYFSKAIELLENEAPKHLPTVYVHLINLAFKNNDVNKAKEYYEIGLASTKEYNLIQYEHTLHMVMKGNYRNIGLLGEAQKAQEKLDQVDAAFKHVEVNHQLSTLEKELLKEIQLKKIKQEKNTQLILAVIITILVLLLTLGFFFYGQNKRKHLIAENNNIAIRQELDEVFKKTLQPAEQKCLKEEEAKLTEKQLDILHLLKEGKSNKEIAERLFISENTVKYHLKIIYKTLNITNRYKLLNK